MMDAGKLDSFITFLAPPDPLQRDPDYNTPSGEWTPFDQDWAQVLDDLPGGKAAEEVAEAVQVAIRRCTVTIRWRDDITAAMRIETESGAVLQIVTPPAEVGRRQWLKFKAEEVTTLGKLP